MADLGVETRLGLVAFSRCIQHVCSVDGALVPHVAAIEVDVTITRHRVPDQRCIVAVRRSPHNCEHD